MPWQPQVPPARAGLTWQTPAKDDSIAQQIPVVDWHPRPDGSGVPLRILVLADLGGRDREGALSERSLLRLDAARLDDLRRARAADPEADAKVESSLESLAFLLSRCAPYAVVVDALDCRKRELEEDFEDALDLTRSALYRTLHADVYHTRGALPFGLVVGDFEFGPSVVDVLVLRSIARVAARAQVHFIAGCSPALFGLSRWSELPTLASPADAASSAPWNALRASPEARYLGLCLPRFALDERLWANAAFAFAARVATSYTTFGWSPNIVGLHPVAGGYINLRAPGDARPARLDAVVTEATERALRACGVIALTLDPTTGDGCFLAAPSCHAPPVAPRSDAVLQADWDSSETALEALNALVCSQIPFMLIATRFAQEVMVHARDGDHPRDREALVASLTRSTEPLVTVFEDAAPGIRARRPMRVAKLTLREHEDGAGYAFTLHVRPVHRPRSVPYFFVLTVEGRLDVG